MTNQSLIACCLFVCKQNEYLGLVEQCMNFAYELMDLCRGTQEVEAVLSECREEDDSCATLARLKMAIEYEEKKASATDCMIHIDLMIHKVSRVIHIIT